MQNKKLLYKWERIAVTVATFQQETRYKLILDYRNVGDELQKNDMSTI